MRRTTGWRAPRWADRAGWLLLLLLLLLAAGGWWRLVDAGVGSCSWCWLAAKAATVCCCWLLAALAAGCCCSSRVWCLPKDS